MVAAGLAFVKWVCCKHRPYYFHYSILFVWAAWSAGKVKDGMFFIHRARQMPAEKCVPLQIMFTQ